VSCGRFRPGGSRGPSGFIPFLLLLFGLTFPLAAAGQTDAAPPGSDSPTSGEEQTPLGKRIVRSLRDEARRYVNDSVALFQAPLHWKQGDWEKAGGVVLVVGGLMFADEKIDREIQNRRSPFTDRVSSATTGFGGVWGLRIAGGLLGAGILLNHENMRDTGREALEAGILATILDKYIIKRAFGRERPFESNGETVFVPGSSHDSFPSGHATQAFAVASVVAARSKGWIIPTIAYGIATVVCVDRVNDRVHFASDVVAGAVLGTAVGRFLVHRHRTEKEGVLSKASFNVVPIRHGLAIAAKY
jgi:membrane-associated phospholipid phosphatase